MPRPYPQEFREDVIRVARNRESGVRIRDIAVDFGISESWLTNWRLVTTRERELGAGHQSGAWTRRSRSKRAGSCVASSQ